MKKNEKHRFMATSKFIGVLVAVIVILVVAYVLVFTGYLSYKGLETGVYPDLTPLTTLVGAVLAAGATYIGFYINMSKAEHIEDKKNEIRKEMNLIKSDGIITDEERIRLDDLYNQLEEISSTLDTIKDNE